MPLEKGNRLGTYEIIASLGAGGMGEVYSARDLKLDRIVAVKVLPPEFTADPERVRRFEAEARLASSLNHPHLVAIHDVGEFATNGAKVHYIAMELVDGTTLRGLIDRERMPLKKALTLLAQAADALAAAHQAGIAHRDVKPENILISRDGYVKVVDFGLAKLREATGTSTENATLVKGTDPGVVMGTLGYMSPEQAEGKTADARSDVFSFGCVLYEAVTGRRAFAGNSRVDTLHKIVSAQPEALSLVAPSTPAQLQWILRKCLAKDPDARYQSMKDLSIDLRELAADLDSGAITPAVSARPNRSWLFAALAIAVVIALATAAVMFSRRRAAPVASALQIKPLTDVGNVIEAALSPDGKYVAYVTSSQGKQQLWLRQIASPQPLLISREFPVAAFWGHVFSPDGAAIFYSLKSAGHLDGALFRVATLGGPSVKLVEGIDSTVAFSPDGSRLLFVKAHYPSRDESAIVTTKVDGSDLRVIAQRKLPATVADLFFSGPAWSPDGKEVAFVSRPAPDSPWMNLTIASSAGGSEREIAAKTFQFAGQLAWLPDGSRLLAIGRSTDTPTSQMWIVPLSSEAPHRVTHDLLAYRIASLSADGRSVVTVTSDMQSSVWSVPLGGGQPVKQSVGKYDGAGGVTLLRDGRTVYSTTENAVTDLFVVKSDGSEPRPFFDQSMMRTVPSASPDGKLIAFFQSQLTAQRVKDSVQRPLVVANADGSGSRVLTQAAVDHVSFTPDGSSIVFATPASEQHLMATMSVSGGSPKILTSYGVYSPDVSPDGKFVAAMCGRPNGAIANCVIPIAGGEPVKTFPSRFDSDVVVRWTPDGKSILYNNAPNDRANIYRQPLDGGPAVKVTPFTDNLASELSVAPDGKSMALVRINLMRDAMLVTGFE